MRLAARDHFARCADACGKESGFTLAARADAGAVVADRLRGRDRLVDVAGPSSCVEDRARPDAGVAVGLQLEPARTRALAWSGILALKATDLVARPAHLLHVVADLVRDHVRPREVAGAPSCRSFAVEARSR